MNYNFTEIDKETLKKRAYNLRWATVPEGVIPLTAADPDIKCAPIILQTIQEYVQGGYFSYSPAEGLPEFKESMSIFLESKRNVVYRKKKTSTREKTLKVLLFSVD